MLVYQRVPPNFQVDTLPGPQEFQVLTESSQHLLGCGCGSCRPGLTLEEAHWKVQRRNAQLSQRRGCLKMVDVSNVSHWAWQFQDGKIDGKSTPWVLGVFAKFQSQMIQVEEVVAADSAGDRTSPDLCFWRSGFSSQSDGRWVQPGVGDCGTPKIATTKRSPCAQFDHLGCIQGHTPKMGFSIQLTQFFPYLALQFYRA